MNRYSVATYTDGPSTLFNVIDRRTQEWIRRFPTEQEALEYADRLEHREENDDVFPGFRGNNDNA